MTKQSRSKTKQTFILSLGGSLINPGEVDTHFLSEFKKLIIAEIKKGSRFILIVGGGRPAREYQAALRKIAQPSKDDLDWMGIYATRFNAHLVRLMFGKLAHKTIVEDPNIRVNFIEKILIAGGWKPGRSTDDDAVRLAKAYGAQAIINLSNIDYVYDKDPNKFKDARKIEAMSWKEFKKQFGTKWDPGAHVPFDPTAAQTASKHKFKVIITNGKDLENLQKILGGLPHQGTVID